MKRKHLLTALIAIPIAAIAPWAVRRVGLSLYKRRVLAPLLADPAAVAPWDRLPGELRTVASRDVTRPGAVVTLPMSDGRWEARIHGLQGEFAEDENGVHIFEGEDLYLRAWDGGLGSTADCREAIGIDNLFSFVERALKTTTATIREQSTYAGVRTCAMLLPFKALLFEEGECYEYVAPTHRGFAWDRRAEENSATILLFYDDGKEALHIVAYSHVDGAARFDLDDLLRDIEIVATAGD